MSNVVAADNTREVARPLKVLVPLIKDEIAQGDEAGIEHYRRAGEMLLEAKEQVGVKGWSGWVERNFKLSRHTAARYMALAERMIGRRRAFATLSEVTEPHRSSHQPTWHESVQKITKHVDMDALVAQEQSRAKERTLTRALALQLIDIGYKVLVTKLHPDKGGSTDAMTRLNRVRAQLREAV